MNNSMQRGYNRPDIKLSGNRSRTGMEKRVKSMDVHPYLKDSFWSNPVNHFWETKMYSEASKNYFRNWLRTTTF